MITRIPSPPSVVPAPLRQAANNPPYPVTDSTMPNITSTDHGGPTFEHVEGQGPSAPNGDGVRSRSSSTSSHDTWNSSGSEEQEKEEGLLPESLRPGPRKSMDQERHGEEIPASLRPGPPKITPNGDARSGIAPNGLMSNGHAPEEHKAYSHTDPQQQPTTPLKSQNPYLHIQASPVAPFASSPVQAPVELPAVNTPKHEMERLSLNAQSAWTESSNPPPLTPTPSSHVQSEHTGKSIASRASQSSNPWQEALDIEKGKSPQQLPSLLDEGPSLPPKGKQPEMPRPAPELPLLNLSGAGPSPSSRPEVDTPRTLAKRQRNEFYHIKHLNWYDASAGDHGSVRQSPILTQNANGPCPLLALVNALVLSTPHSDETELVRTMKAREQISLGLLLDAVFDELVRRSERYGHELPDIGDLYSFLITLHTGMNVNPVFTPTTPTQPGGFEQTREMKLYGSFDLPLVHGWIAPPDLPVSQAFQRSAKTFDEALNMQFLDEEFEHKLHAGGLNNEEQQVFEDLTAVKDFLTTYPTQLSEHGLRILSSWMKPGQVAILFRNDHFCTLYKEPKKGVLMMLVTDAGYATHDEVVWESLVDVNGAKAEFFSGDFRPVGAAPSASRQGSGQGDAANWQSENSRPIPHAPGDAKVDMPSAQQADLPPPQSQSEQEDLDLALALQLQEEEEEAHRREAASRQNAENESLSRQYLDRHSSETEQRPPIPPRRSQRSPQPGTYSGPIQAASRTDDGTAPPPTYEEAASDMPYREAGSTPRPPRQGNPLTALSALDAQRQQSAFTAQSGQHGPVMAPGYGRRRPSRFGSAQGPPSPGYQQANHVGSSGREEKCVVM